MSYLFFSNDYHTEHFGELEPLIKIKNKKLACIVSFLVPIPIAVGLIKEIFLKMKESFLKIKESFLKV